MASAEEAKGTRLSQWLHAHRRNRSKAPVPDEASGELTPESAQQFFREKGSTHHPAFGEPTQWDDKEGRLKAEARLAVEYLEDVLRSHDENASPGAPRFYNCRWETVFMQIAATKGEGDKIAAHLWGIDFVKGFVDFFPEDQGLGVIKGALGLIFESTTRHLENKVKIVETFETLPETILTITTAYAHLEPSKSDLDAQQELYDTVLTRLPTLVNVLLGKEKWYKKITRFLTFAFSESLLIDEILDDWKGCIARLQEHVRRLDLRATGATLGYARDTNEKVNEIHKVLFSKGRTETARRSAAAGTWCLQHKDTGAEAQTGMFKYMADLITQEKQDKAHLRRLYEEQTRRLQDENDKLNSKNQELDDENERLRMQTTLQIQRRATEPLVTPIELIGMLGIRPELVWEDLEHAVRAGAGFDDAQLGRARWLLRTGEFLDWFRAPRPSLLLVEGHMAEHAHASLTPLSVLGSTLASSLAAGAADDDVVLFFFCGLRCAEASADGTTGGGPNAMIRSLITQLLLHGRMPQPALDFLTARFWAACADFQTRALCQLFEELVFQIPPLTRVYCILDGVVWYELEEHWAADLDCIAAMFQHLAEKMADDGGSRFLKLLMLFPSHSLMVSDRADREPHLWGSVSLAAGWTDAAYVSPLEDITESQFYDLY